MKLPEPLATQESNGLPNSAVYEAIVRDCAAVCATYADSHRKTNSLRYRHLVYTAEQCALKILARYELEPK